MIKVTVYEMVTNGKSLTRKLVGEVETDKTPQTLAFHCKQKFNKKFCVTSNGKSYYSR